MKLQWLDSVKLKLSAQAGLDSLSVRWGMVLIALILLWSMALEPYLEWREGRQQSIHINAEKLVRLQALESSAEAWSKSLRRHTTAFSSLSEQVFQSSSSAASQAALLQLTRRLITEHKLVLEGQGFVDMVAEPGVGERIAVRMSLRGSLKGVVGFIDAISRHHKLMVMSDLYVNGVGRSGYLLQLQISGFRLLGHE